MDKDTELPEKNEVLEEAKERFKYALEAWEDNRQSALEDMQFRAGDHWPQEVKDSRDKEGRPCLVVDKLNQYIRQVVNDGRQNRPSVKVRPVDDGADPDVADIYQGIIRHILDRSNADTAFDAALESAVVGGFGYFRVLTEYAHKNTFNQEIAVKRIRNPLAVVIDPDCKEADGSDMRYAFVIDEIDEEDYEKQYPDAKEVNWDDTSKYGDWYKEDKVLVCEYWHREVEPVTMHLLHDGTTVDDTLYQKAISEGLNPPPVKDTRVIEKDRIKWCRLSGAEILEEREWLGEYIPIIPVYGNEYDIDGKVIYSGLVRVIKDPQRIYNYSRSAFVERVALTPKAPYVAAAGQVENYPEWEDANSGNYSVLRYDPIDIGGTALGAPQRQQAADIPAGFSQDMQLAEHDIQAAIGMYAASLGQQSNEKSGKAILARQREGDVGTFHYHDNLQRAIRHLGRILVDLIPKVYDSQRIMRILGEDGTAEQVEINPMQPMPVQKIGSKSIYNLNAGIYDVTVAAGASYTTKRQEASDAMIAITQANPAAWNTHGDLIAKMQDWPNADEWAERSRLFLPPHVQQAEKQDEEGQQIPPQIRQALDMATQHIQQQEQVIQQMQAALNEKQTEQQKAQLDAQIQSAKLQLEGQKNDIERMRAETERMQVAVDAQNSEEAKLLLDKYKADLEAETIRWKAELEAQTKIQVEAMQGLGRQFDVGVE